MKMKWVRSFLIPLVLIALIVSISWTYVSIQASAGKDPVKEITLEISPDYLITSGKELLTWPAGTVFEQGRAAYFYAVGPLLDVAPTMQLYGMERGKISGTVKSQVTIQAVDDKAQIYWSYLIKDNPAQNFTLSKGEAGTGGTSFFTGHSEVLDVAGVYDKILQISNELMFQTGIFQLVVTYLIDINGTVNGIDIDKEITQTLPLTLQSVSFSIPKSQDVMSLISFHEEMSSQSIQQMLFDMVQDNFIPIILNLGLFVLLIILLILSNARKSKAAMEHRRYREWITEGSVEIKDRFHINILTLEGLVDLAIDLDKRVIYDSRINKYYVLTEDIVYVYDSDHTHAMLENKQQLGKLLLERGLLKPEQLEIGLYYQKKIGSRLGESLIALGFIDETTLFSTLAGQQGIDYYEPDTKKVLNNTDWLSKLSVQKAKALMALPLGERVDGKLVIASSEASREGIQKALQDVFDKEIIMVATRPSLIYEALERIDIMEKQRTNIVSNGEVNSISPLERLSVDELEAFITSYYRGNIKHDLFIKASGLVDPVVLTQVPEHEPMLSWLVNKNMINGEIVNLIKGLDKIMEAMDWKTRQLKQIPELLDLLMKANYLTANSAEFILREQELRKEPVEKLLDSDYLASHETIKKAKLLLDTLSTILNKK
ncbi:MAG: hypothetical protein K0S76_1632 [Herbinix sp.]|jgi:hypothetical protein|nr:hypothetical protein [Herbinix sp.]